VSRAKFAHVDYGDERRRTAGLDMARPLLGAAPPLLRTAAARRWAWALLCCCAIVVIALGIPFAHQSTADGFDRVLDGPVKSLLSGHGTLAYRMTYPGDQLPAVVLSVAMALGSLRSRRLNGAILALAAVFTATRVDEWLLKPLFDRKADGALSYPSGHTTSVVAMITVYVVLFVLPPFASARARRWSLLGLLAFLALLVSTLLGVIGLGWHYFTDTIGGAAVAVGTVCGLCLLLDAVLGSVFGGVRRWRQPG
jgi:membrane-associated phospholipid phosphatase